MGRRDGTWAEAIWLWELETGLFWLYLKLPSHRGKCSPMQGERSGVSWAVGRRGRRQHRPGIIKTACSVHDHDCDWVIVTPASPSHPRFLMLAETKALLR